METHICILYACINNISEKPLTLSKFSASKNYCINDKICLCVLWVYGNLNSSFCLKQMINIYKTLTNILILK